MAANRKRKDPFVTSEELQQLSKNCDEEIAKANQLLEEATELCERWGESVSTELTGVNQGGQALSAAFTCGHSNTDHFIVWTNDYETDRIAEYKRNMMARVRARQPEGRGEDRWDKPRIQGERRRRIVRDKDAPEAPPEPPITGYVIFVGQMTTKMRHDRPDIPHNQTAVVQEISKHWRITLSDEERAFYTSFAEQARKEYEVMNLEYRATGTFRPSRKFQRLEGAGPWIHVRLEDRNGLENEIAGYSTVQFPPRPPEFDEAYHKRDKESKRKRKLKLRGMLNPDGTERSEPLPLPFGKKRRRRKLKPPPEGSEPGKEEDTQEEGGAGVSLLRAEEDGKAEESEKSEPSPDEGAEANGENDGNIEN